MRPIRFRIDGPGCAAAEAVLARYLPGLDVQLFAYRPGTALLPPHLQRALDLSYGKGGALAVLALAGLVDGTPVEWAQVIRWATAQGRTWEQGGEPAAAALADSGIDWHLRMCNVETAWNALGGRDHIDWAGVRVGHVDTGHTLHPVFGFPGASWIDLERTRTFVADPPPADGTDTLTGASGGHGTTSASICCGADGGAAYHGVAPRVPLVPVRISDCVVIDQRANEFESAVRYLVDEAGAVVINVSMGTFLKARAPTSIRRAVDHCYQRGVILVGAAGNVPTPDWPAFPAALPRAISVAGVTQDAVPWCGSSYGADVDFSAPARRVRRAMATRGSAYGYQAGGGGTTFAAAMTSGAAALWLVKHAADLHRNYPLPWQRIEAFRRMARSTASVPPRWVPDRGFGAGILDVARLMDPSLLPQASALAYR